MRAILIAAISGDEAHVRGRLEDGIKPTPSNEAKANKMVEDAAV